MAKGTHRAPRRTFGTVSLVLTMVMMLTVMAFAPMAGAQVERYQFTEDTYVLDLYYSGHHYYHEYVVSLDNPCDGTYSFSGRYLGQTLPGSTQFTETVSDWVQTATTISFRSDYDINSYYFTFLGTVDGVDTWTGTGASGSQTFDDMTLTRTNHWASDYNHGEYVAESVEEYGSPDAHSCIGMPIVSNKNK